jgi:hypothetical protein
MDLFVSKIQDTATEDAEKALFNIERVVKGGQEVIVGVANKS